MATKAKPLKYPHDISKHSILDGRIWVKQNRRKAVKCPTCHQTAAERKRYLHHSMAKALVIIHWYFKKYPMVDWLHVEEHLKKHPNASRAVRGDFAKLVHWNLLEKKSGTKPDGNPSIGRYRITPLGKKFVREKVKVPAYVWIYNAKCCAISTKTIGIRDVRGKKFFHYDNLMLSKGLSNKPQKA